MVHSPDIVASQLAYATLITYIFQFLRLFLIPGWWIPTAECGIVAWLRLASQTLSNYPDLLSCIFLRNISSKSKLIGKITIIRGIWYICLRRACCRRNNTKGWHSPLHSKFIYCIAELWKLKSQNHQAIGAWLIISCTSLLYPRNILNEFIDKMNQTYHTGFIYKI